MFINVSFLEPHWINKSKCLVLSVFTSDFDHFAIPTVFHCANFVSVEFLSNYKILFKETRKTFFCLLIVWRIGEKIECL